MTKDELRAAMKELRRALSVSEINEKTSEILKSLTTLDAFTSSGTVMTYLSAFKEPSTDGIIDYLFRSGKRIVVPVSNTDSCTITPSLLTSPDKLIKGAYGIKEPSECIEVPIENIDIALIPGIVFDRSGMRIGFGKGYYDRFLSEFQGVKIGICYDFQIQESIPSSPHDIAMDIIITEKRIYNDF